MEFPTVSIILTSYNKPSMVGKAIESVLNQTYQSWELFIMDDESNENTKKVIENYRGDKRIFIVYSGVEDEKRYKTTRYATLINEAISRTKGKYITYLTDDTIYLPQRLEKMVRMLESKEKEVVYSSQKVFHLDDNSNMMMEYTRKTKGILNQAANVVDHCSVMHTKNIAENIYSVYGDYWDDDPKCWHNGDAAFWVRLNEFTPFYPINEVLDMSYNTPHSFQSLNANLPENIPEGTLVKGVGTDVYKIENNKRRKITEEVFEKLRYKASKIVEIPNPSLYKYHLGYEISQEVFHYPDLFPNGSLICANNSPIYYIQDRKKRMIIDNNALIKFKFTESQLVVVKEELLNQFDEDKPISSNISSETILPDQVLFKNGDRYFLSYNNYLHPIQVRVLNKLKINLSLAVKITRNERLYFGEGYPFLFQYFKKEKQTRSSRGRRFKQKRRLNYSYRLKEEFM